MTAPTVLYGVTVATSVQTLLRGQLGWLRDQGWDVHVACSPDEALDDAAEREGFTPHPLPMSRAMSPVRDLAALWEWLRLLRSVRPQVTNVSTPKAALLGSIAARLAGVPRRVYVVRGLRLEGASGPGRWLLWLAERLTIALSTDVVVVSSSLGHALRASRLLGRRRALLIGDGSSNGVPAQEIATRAAAARTAGARESLGLPSDRLVVGYVGRLVADKGIDTLLAGAAAARSAPALLLVGSMDEPSLATAIEAAALPVVHVPWTDDVRPYYAAMDVLCLPTLREGFPNVVLEAAAAGVPAIATDATGAVDAVVDGVTGITVGVGDTAALAAAIDRLSAAPDERARLGDAARDRAVRDFRPERIWSGVAATMRGVEHPDARTI
jgi:glycosyltransferase involved in cell wall biosynthesis